MSLSALLCLVFVCRLVLCTKLHVWECAVFSSLVLTTVVVLLLLWALLFALCCVDCTGLRDAAVAVIVCSVLLDLFF